MILVLPTNTQINRGDDMGLVNIPFNHVSPHKEKRFIQFYSEFVDGCDTKLTLMSNSVKDSRNLILSIDESKDMKEPLFLKISDESIITFMGLSLDQAEELAQELMTAVNFLKE